MNLLINSILNIVLTVILIPVVLVAVRQGIQMEMLSLAVQAHKPRLDMVWVIVVVMLAGNTIQAVEVVRAPLEQIQRIDLMVV